MARPPRRSWSDGLPPELVAIIMLQLNCLADRVYFEAVCRAWRSAASFVDGVRRGVPWLLLPSRDAPSFFSLHSGVTRGLNVPEAVRGARLCGAYDGGWVAVAADPWRGFSAVNLFSGVRVAFPEKLSLELPYSNTYAAGQHNMLIRSIVFSAPPSSENCVAAAHVSSSSNIAFWKPGMSTHWAALGRESDVIQDMIYHSGELLEGFHVLTNREEVRIYAPLGDNPDPDAPLEMIYTTHPMHRRDDYQPDKALLPTSFTTRYLAESRGRLLMVLRHYTGNQCVGRRTHMFRIFEMRPSSPAYSQPQNGAAATEGSWVELPELSGRALFLGRGCSRVVEVAEFDMLQEGTIYYLDDANLDLSTVLNNGSNIYRNTDMGIFRKGEMITTGAQQFPLEFTADCSPPLWLVP
ncbi:hypothetical protein GUJ93_ZPchr0001g31831 [Zizania palustris]|uniref:KIB1-4 beta-propeller domain-containing protein n=1 Tax=Zizania palustris TaxID=103762 RepID=A0A8J5SHB4_ZIZPA|nr:hypothetical protein GUJ93_ZPchr0001g31831 [Zizania palustris]